MNKINFIDYLRPLMHIMQRKRYADMHGYKLLYTTNQHPAYSLYGGKLSELFTSISDIEDSEIIDFVDKNYSQANHNTHFVLKYTDTKQYTEKMFSQDVIQKRIKGNTVLTEIEKKGMKT